MQKVAQIGSQIERGAVPVSHAMREGLETDSFKLFWNQIIHLARRSWLRRRGSRKPICGEQSSAGQEFIEHNSEAEYVRPSINQVPFPAELLRAHVLKRPDGRFVFPEILLLERNSEIGQIGTVADVQEDVCWFDVPVHNPVHVGAVQSIGDGSDSLRRGGKGQWALFYLSRQITPLDVFRNNEAQSVVRAAAIVNGDNRVVLEACEDPRFGQIRFNVPRLGDPITMRNLDCDLALEDVVISQIDPPEAAVPQDSQHPISSDFLGMSRPYFAITYREPRKVGARAIPVLHTMIFAVNSRSHRGRRSTLPVFAGSFVCPRSELRA